MASTSLTSSPPAVTVMACAVCGKQYRVKGSVEGKILRCKCGQELVPAKSPAHEPEVVVKSVYAQAAAERKKVARAVAAGVDQVQANPLLEIYVPLLLAVIGMAAHIVLSTRILPEKIPASYYLPITLGLEALVFFPLALLSVMTVANLTGNAVGTLKSLAFRTGVVVLGAGLADLLFFHLALGMNDEMIAPFLGIAPYLVLCAAPLAFWYGFTIAESAMLAVALYIPRLLAFVVLHVLLPDLFKN